MKERWPAIRAGLIAFVLLVHGVLALPVPSNVSDKAFDNAIAREELKSWSALLGDLGYPVEPEELGERVLELGKSLAGTKKAFLKPFRPFLRATGTGQAWGLFTYPNTTPNQLVVSVRGSPDEPWEPLYEALSEEHDWHESHFRYRRVRGVYDDNATRVRASYDNFVHWVAEEAFEDHPEAQQVRVHMVQRVSRAPGEEPDDTKKVRLVRVVTREAE